MYALIMLMHLGTAGGFFAACARGLLASQRFWDHMAYLDMPTIARVEEVLAQRLIVNAE